MLRLAGLILLPLLYFAFHPQVAETAPWKATAPIVRGDQNRTSISIPQDQFVPAANVPQRKWTYWRTIAVARSPLHVVVGGSIVETHGIGSLIEPLQREIRELVDVCHTRLVSAYRPGAHVAGTRRPSLHSVYPSRAADVTGNPACVYAHLRGWRGGYSTDYGHVRHVHISYSPPGSGYLGGREWGVRFAHHGVSRRLAHRPVRSQHVAAG